MVTRLLFIFSTSIIWSVTREMKWTEWNEKLKNILINVIQIHSCPRLRKSIHPNVLFNDMKSRACKQNKSLVEVVEAWESYPNTSALFAASNSHDEVRKKHHFNSLIEISLYHQNLRDRTFKGWPLIGSSHYESNWHIRLSIESIIKPNLIRVFSQLNSEKKLW